MKFATILPNVISEWLINLSASWVAAGLIFHVASKIPKQLNTRLLTINLFLAILSLLFAVILRTV